MMTLQRIKCPDCGSVEIYANEQAAYNEWGEVIGYDQDPECAMCGCFLDETWINISEEEYQRQLAEDKKL